MPTLLSERTLTIDFSDLDNRKPIERSSTGTLPRHPGVHQSGVLAWIAREVGWLKPGVPLEEEMPWNMAMGVMWEEFYFSLLLSVEPDVIWQPGEVVTDGIAVNCDGLGWWDGDTALLETKCMKKKVRSGEDFLQDRLWMYQGMAYCHCYRVLVVRWVILFYDGDYAGSGPVVKEYVVRFSEEEIRNAWAMYVKFRDKAEPEVY